MKTCPECNTHNENIADFCSKCGASFEEMPTLVPMSSQQQTTVILPNTSASPVPAENGTITRTLAKPAPFAPLPEGAFVVSQQAEYQIKHIQSESEQLNIYTAVGINGVRVCKNCSFIDNPASENYCSNCGQDLSDSLIAHLHYTLKESPNRNTFATEADLAELDLSDPALRAPRHAFSQRVGGATRHYVVLLPAPVTRLGHVQPPQEAHQVLEWGASLARGLDTLHGHKIAFGALTGQRLGVESGQASLSDFQSCIIPGRERDFQEEIRQLASFLFYLITGRKQITQSLTLPGHVEELLVKTVTTKSAFKTAGDFADALDEALEQIRRPSSLNLVLGRRTDVGMVRQLNEDSLFTLDMVHNNQSISVPMGVYAVADGMGGHAAGEVASGLALEAVSKAAIEDVFMSSTKANAKMPNGEKWVKRAAEAANTAVHDEVQATKNDMGTTLTLAYVVGSTAHIANVGDSRAYVVNTDGIRQVTVDHSLVERLVATGQITREEARYHPQGNIIYRTIGDKSRVEVDTFEVTLKPGDSLLLCSDGLNGMLDDEAIYRLVANAPSPQVASDQLIQAANQAGGVDNVTAIVVRVDAVQ